MMIQFHKDFFSKICYFAEANAYRIQCLSNIDFASLLIT